MIVKCVGKNCEIRNDCYRYRSHPITQGNWDNFDERRGLVCRFFIPLGERNHLKPMDWLEMEDD